MSDIRKIGFSNSTEGPASGGGATETWVTANFRRKDGANAPWDGNYTEGLADGTDLRVFGEVTDFLGLGLPAYGSEYYNAVTGTNEVFATTQIVDIDGILSGATFRTQVVRGDSSINQFAAFSIYDTYLGAIMAELNSDGKLTLGSDGGVSNPAAGGKIVVYGDALGNERYRFDETTAIFGDAALDQNPNILLTAGVVSGGDLLVQTNDAERVFGVDHSSKLISINAQTAMTDGYYDLNMWSDGVEGRWSVTRIGGFNTYAALTYDSDERATFRLGHSGAAEGAARLEIFTNGSNTEPSQKGGFEMKDESGDRLLSLGFDGFTTNLDTYAYVVGGNDNYYYQEYWFRQGSPDTIIYEFSEQNNYHAWFKDHRSASHPYLARFEWQLPLSSNTSGNANEALATNQSILSLSGASDADLAAGGFSKLTTGGGTTSRVAAHIAYVDNTSGEEDTAIYRAYLANSGSSANIVDYGFYAGRLSINGTIGTGFYADENVDVGLDVSNADVGINLGEKQMRLRNLNNYIFGMSSGGFVASTDDSTGVFVFNHAVDDSGGTVMQINHFRPSGGATVADRVGLTMSMFDDTLVPRVGFQILSTIVNASAASYETRARIFIQNNGEVEVGNFDAYGLSLFTGFRMSVSGYAGSEYVSSDDSGHLDLHAFTSIDANVILNASAAGIRTKVSVADVSNPPTDAQLDAAFGTPAALGNGFVGIVDDNDADTDSYICWTTAGAWFYAVGTLAT